MEGSGGVGGGGWEGGVFLTGAVKVMSHSL